MVGRRVGSASVGGSLDAVDLGASDPIAYEEPDRDSRVDGIAC